jgi:predicted phage terminase large subunit-like protein
MAHAVGHEHKMLWVDTIQGNLDRYVERFFLPVLKKNLPVDMWNWNQQKKEMKIIDTIIDFRSAERPANIEGFGYHRIIVNEAGIILKGDRGRYLWNNAILPMTMDYQDCIVYFGGTPKGRTDGNGSDCLYYDMFQRAENGRENYYHINIPTEKNPFLDPDVVNEVIEELPEGPIRDQEAYGKFVDSSDGYIEREWLRIDDIPISGEKIIGIDLAVTEKKKNDETAIVLMVKDGEYRYQIQEIEHFREKWPNAKERIMSFIERHNCPAIIESNAQMIGLIDDLNNEKRMQAYTIEGKPTKRDKITSAAPWISRLEKGNLTLLRGQWNKAFINQAIAFTGNDKDTDDILDGTSRCWEGFNGDGDLSISFL